MARIVRFHHTGDADVLQIDDLPLQEPKEGEVRIKVEAIGLNRAEVMFRRGQYLEPPELPSRIGYEAAGVIDAVGRKVAGLKVGDRVSTIPSFSMCEYGVYGESAVVPAYAAAVYPANLSPVEGAAIWMQYITAYGALVEYGKVKAGDPVVITAASSSVGCAAIELCRDAGAVAIATTRTAAKRQALLDGGASHVVVTDEEDLAGRVMEITGGKGATLCFDPVAGPFLPRLAEACAAGATIFEYGALYPEATPFPLFTALRKGLTVRGYTLFEIARQPDSLARAKAYILARLESGRFKPVIDRTFPLEAIADAHRYMLSNQQNGKIVVTV
jgi:NADPH:quinone reductase-like Zn-dependent oxidoreductase